MLLNLHTYHRPESIDEAVTLLRQNGPKTVALAGGTALLASGRRDIEAVVDLRPLPLSYVRVQSATLCIGATTTLQQLVSHPELQAFASRVLVQTAQAEAGRNLRNAATVGGTIASARGDSFLLTSMLALDAQLTIYAPESRQIPLAGFLAYRRRLLDDGALIAEVRLPLLIGPLGAAAAAVGRTPRDRPIVCAVARFELAAGIASNVRVALGGVASVPVRANATEQLLERKPLSDERIEAAVEMAADGLAPEGDFRGSAEYRREIARVLARRTIYSARVQAQAWGSTFNVEKGDDDEDRSND